MVLSAGQTKHVFGLKMLVFLGNVLLTLSSLNLPRQAPRWGGAWLRAVREGGLSEEGCVRVSCPCRLLFWFQYDARVRGGVCVCLRVCECVF